VIPKAGPDFPEILQHFELTGHFAGAERFGSGHINDTWLVRIAHADCRRRYVLQRLNDTVFADPLAVMENIDRLTAHIGSLPGARTDGRLAGQPGLRPLRTRDDRACWQSDAGQVWRLWPFVYGARTVDAAGTPGEAREAARAFGIFQHLVADLPGPPLNETIAGFHDTPQRFLQLCRAIDEDPCDRVRHCEAEIEFAMRQEEFIRSFFDLARSGTMTERIVHNDAKINNVLLDERTGGAVCVVDLDTVMPGYTLFDLGDMIRTMTTLAAEDETDAGGVTMQMDFYEAVVSGYLSVADGLLSPAETDSVPDAGRLITLETGLRFLADHLSGDTYFRTTRENQNLDRCRTQFALVRSIDRQVDTMRAVTREIAGRLGTAG